MKILVVGAGGVGASFAPIAARRDFYEHIVFADYDEGRTQSVVDRYDGGTGRFETSNGRRAPSSVGIRARGILLASGC